MPGEQSGHHEETGLRIRLFFWVLLLAGLVALALFLAQFARNNPPTPTEIRTEVPYEL